MNTVDELREALDDLIEAADNFLLLRRQWPTMTEDDLVEALQKARQALQASMR